jgi:Glycosyl transferase family 2
LTEAVEHVSGMRFYNLANRAIGGLPSLLRRAAPPRVVMTLLCRNEGDIIAEQITFHLAMGVDFVLATDNGSSDRTLEILEQFQKRGKLRLMRAARYEQSKLVTHMARLAATEHDADWVINSDADEFWWPRRGDLKTTLGELDRRVNVVVANRVNFRPALSEENSLFYERMIVRELLSEKFRGGLLEPKVAHRAFSDVTVGPVITMLSWAEEKEGARLATRFRFCISRSAATTSGTEKSLKAPPPTTAIRIFRILSPRDGGICEITTSATARCRSSIPN